MEAPVDIRQEICVSSASGSNSADQLKLSLLPILDVVDSGCDAGVCRMDRVKRSIVTHGQNI